jgi:ribonuclease P protein component
MLPAVHRLRDRRDFQRTYRQGKVLRLPHFRIHTHPNQSEVSRLGFVVPNKVIKKASYRNRQKRQLRGLFHVLLPHLSSGYDIVIVAQAGCMTLSYQDLAVELIGGFQQIRFLPVGAVDQFLVTA